MSRRLLIITLCITALAVSGGVVAKVSLVTEAQPATAPVDEMRASPVYERIVVDDPAVRAQIEQLYAQDRALQAETMRKLSTLQNRIAAETDWEVRRVLLDEARSLKENLEIGHIEIGLHIAELNGDTQRAEDFARALDQVRNADERRLSTFADPSIEAERKRTMDW